MDNKTKKSKKRWKYSKENANAALKMLEQRGVTLGMVQKIFNIPRSTLSYLRKQGKATEYTVLNHKRPVKLSEEEETTCINWIYQQYQQQLPLRRWDLIDYVEEILKSHPGPSKIRPGRSWFELFMKRHPEIQIDKQSRIIPSIARDWLQDFESYLKGKNALEILKNPGSRIWNCIQMNFRYSPFFTKFFGLAKSSTLIPGSDEINVSVFLSISSDGQLGPVFIVYPYNKPPENPEFTEKFPPDLKMKFSDYGEMTAELFLEYLKEFLEFVSVKNVLWPIVMLVDCIPGIFSTEPRSFMEENDMILFGVEDEPVYFNKGVYESLRIWKTLCLKLKKEEPDLKVEDFAPSIMKLLDQLNPSAIVSARVNIPSNKAVIEAKAHNKAATTTSLQASTSAQSSAAPSQWRLAQFLILPDGTSKLITNSVPVASVGILPPQLPQVMPDSSADTVQPSEAVWLNSEIKEEPMDSEDSTDSPRNSRLDSSECDVKEEPLDIPDIVPSELVLIKTEPLECSESVFSNDNQESVDSKELSAKFGDDENSGSVKFVDIEDIFNQK